MSSSSVVHSSWSFAAWIEKPPDVHACTRCGRELEPRALIGPGDQSSRIPVCCVKCAWILAPRHPEIQKALARAGIGRA